MQHQPPDKNNPANPLLKVAALTLDKEYLALRPHSRIRLIATLNFKRSSDLRGSTKTKNGNDVTVSFSLALRRASLEVSFEFESPKKANVNIDQVAHISELQTRDKIEDERRIKKQRGKGASVGAGLTGKAGAGGLVVGALVTAKASAGVKSKTTRDHKVSRSISTNNISGTYAGSLLHWEINPSLALEGVSGSESPAWLEGEMFKSSRGKSIDACVASWRHDEKLGPPNIVASVYVMMPDLIIENVSFLTETGNAISFRDIDQASVTLFGAFEMTDAKERLARQVVRKHLISQGMVTEGARVQICKASC